MPAKNRVWGQCGGMGWYGTDVCEEGTCTYMNLMYSEYLWGWYIFGVLILIYLLGQCVP